MKLNRQVLDTVKHWHSDSLRHRFASTDVVPMVLTKQYESEKRQKELTDNIEKCINLLNVCINVDQVGVTSGKVFLTMDIGISTTIISSIEKKSGQVYPIKYIRIT